MDSLKRNKILSGMAIFVLILGFQNCGDSSFQNVDNVRLEPASSLIANDTKYKEGLDFSVMSLSSGSTDLALDFKISKSRSEEYNVSQNDSLYNCSFENPNSSEELLQISELTSISHPSMVDSAFDVCDSSGTKDIYYAIGRQSVIYLVVKDENEDCYSGDPQKLLDQNKRVFVVENLFLSEITGLIDTVEQDVQSGSNCTEFNAD